MAASINVEFESFRVNRRGSAGSAVITFSLWERVSGEPDRFLAELPLATPVTGGGIPGMIAVAAQDIARDFRRMAEEAELIAKTYQAQNSS